MTQQTALTGYNRDAAEAISRTTGEPQWARDLRLEALRVYDDTPMPQRTDEQWRRTDLSGLRLDNFTPTLTDVAPHAPQESAALLQSIESLSGLAVQRNAASTVMECAEQLANGVVFTTLEAALRDHGDLVRRYLGVQGVLPTYNKFAALNASFWSGGLFLYVPAGVAITDPFANIRWLDRASGILTRTLVVLERGASATLVDGAVSTPTDGQAAPNGGQALHSGVTDFFLADGAELSYVNVQQWGTYVWDFSLTKAALGRDSRLKAFSAGLGSHVSRMHLDAVLEGAASDARLRGFYIGTGRQHFDYRTLQDHVAAHTTSDLLFKGALRDKGSAAYEGTVRVRHGASGSSANQANHNLLLTTGAKADSVPVLEIEANDVDKCSHGATVGQVDEAQMFYLQSRGLTEDEAHRLIVAGFFAQIMDGVSLPGVREYLTARVAEKLAMAHGEGASLLSWQGV